MNAAEIVYRPESFRRRLIDNPAELGRHLERLEGNDALGVDAEMVQRVKRRPGGQQEWVQVLALIQVAGSDTSLVVDRVRCQDLSPLRPLMAGEATKVFLGGGQDVALLEQAGIPVRNILDVGEVALAVFGRREDGMAALARRIFGISLDKTVRRADWLERPINPVLLSYAHQDAELTLLIYRWFEAHYPDVIAVHRRKELEPPLPSGLPGWITQALKRPGNDVLGIVMEHGLRPAEDVELMSEQMRPVLARNLAPRQTNKLLRIASDAGLKPLLPQLKEFAQSPSSLIRASVARAIGELGEDADDEQLLQRLQEDPVEDVQKAAEAGLKEFQRQRRLQAREPAAGTASETEDATSLDEEAQAKLGQLLEQLQREG